jgi:MYXO-CTERM domain-containing protein
MVDAGGPTPGMDGGTPAPDGGGTPDSGRRRPGGDPADPGCACRTAGARGGAGWMAALTALTVALLFFRRLKF